MHLRFEREFPVAAAALFRFHEDPRNLAFLSGDEPGFRVLSHDGGIQPGARTRVRVGLGPLGLTVEMEHRIHEPPVRFGEEQVRGPFARFSHVHEFEPRPGGTLLRERLEVRLPWWLGGEAAVRWIAAPRLRRYFAARHDRLARLAAEGGLGPPP